MIFKISFILKLFICFGVAICAQQGDALVELTVDREELSLQCRPGSRSVGGVCSDGTSLKVQPKVSQQIDETLNYNYQVNSGKIIGTGAQVIWDLAPLRPRTYQISVGVFDGSGNVIGRATRSVTVTQCLHCTGDCFCHARLEVTANATNVLERKTVVFTSISNVETTYRWKVYGGRIIKGQGTRSITVRALSAKNYNNVIATVTSTLNPDSVCPECSSNLEATAAVILEPLPKLRKR